MRNIIKPGLILFAVTVVASLVLALAYVSTKDIIRTNSAAAKRESMAKILPAVVDSKFDEAVETDIDDKAEGVTSYSAGYGKDGICGYVLTVITKGYGGDIEMLVGLDQLGIIQGIDILEHKETPGLGANADTDAFKARYMGKSGELKVVKTLPKSDKEVQAVTSATITSKAVTHGVNMASEFFTQNLKERGK